MKTPQITAARIAEILDANGIPRSPYAGKAVMIGIRGYYLDSMGVRGRNDRRIYDDAIIIHCPRGHIAFQANTDPNGFRKGRGTGAGKGMAMLKPGIHLYGIGRHKNIPAYRQTEPITVIRDGSPDYEDTGWHAINIHPGGVNSTSSLGCQTFPPATWAQAKSTFDAWLEEYANPKRKNDLGQLVRSFPYLLLEETAIRSGNLIASRRFL